MKPEEAVARAEELVSSERLAQMVRAYKASPSDLDRMQEIVESETKDRAALRIAVRWLAGTI